MTYARLPALAQQGQRAVTRPAPFEIDADRRRTRGSDACRSRMVLQGDYESFRQFIYELESAPEFVIIDDVTLAQSEAGQAADARRSSCRPTTAEGQWQPERRRQIAARRAASSCWRSSLVSRLAAARPPRRARRLTERRRAATARPAATPQRADAPDVHLEALDAERPKPGGAIGICSGSSRSRRRRRRRRRAAGRRRRRRAAPPVPPRPPPPPPIALKFIGIVEAPGSRRRSRC